MKQILLLVNILLINDWLSGQSQVDIGIFASVSANQMEVRIRPTYAEDGSHFMTNGQFTVRWLASSGITSIVSGAPIFPYLYTPQGPPLSDGGYYYQRYASAGGFPLTWSASQEVIVQTFTFTSPPCPVFGIADDAFVHQPEINGAFYFEINGGDKTGIIYQAEAQQPYPANAGPITGTSAVCQSQVSVPYSIAAVPNATGYEWNYSGTGGTIIGDGPSITMNFSLSATSGILTVYATNGCGGGPVSPDYTITVLPPLGIPVFTLGTSSERCQGAGMVTYTASADNTTGMTYSLDAVSLAGGNTIEMTTGSVTFTSDWTGISTITATAEGCPSPLAADHTVTTHALPVVTCPPDMESNVDDPAFELSGASPVGGTYDGPGVTNGLFYPDSAGVGQHTIFYTFIDENGCNDSCTFLIIVLENAIYGDANCDGVVNVLDIITIVNYIMGIDPVPFCYEEADTNSDLIVNVLDIIGTVNIIMAP